MAEEKKQIKKEKQAPINTNEIVIDASNATLGRLSSYAAKQSLLGKSIIIVNCNDAIITGDKRTTINKYKRLRSMGGLSQRGPYFPKSPERLVKRAIRGMLSHRQSRGKEALQRIMCYNSVPAEYEQKPKIKAGREKIQKSISLYTLSREI